MVSVSADKINAFTYYVEGEGMNGINFKFLLWDFEYRYKLFLHDVPDLNLPTYDLNLTTVVSYYIAARNGRLWNLHVSYK